MARTVEVKIKLQQYSSLETSLQKGTNGRSLLQIPLNQAFFSKKMRDYIFVIFFVRILQKLTDQ